MRGPEAGVSIIEVVVGLAVVALIVAGSAAAWSAAGRIAFSSGEEKDAWSAVRYQAETLLHQGHEAAVSGSGTVLGHAVEWTVTGADPKKAVIVARRRSAVEETVADTVVLYLSGIR